jgi:hypothetical protein
MINSQRKESMNNRFNPDDGFQPSAYNDNERLNTPPKEKTDLHKEYERVYPQFFIEEDEPVNNVGETFGGSYLISQQKSDEIKETKRKKDFLTNGSQRATDILIERAEFINKTSRNIHDVLDHVERIGSPIGVFAGCMLDGLVGGALGQMVNTYGVKLLHRTNKKVTARQLKFVNRTINAIKECNDPNIGIDKKKEDYEIALRTAHFIENFEKSEKVLNLAGKFCLTLSLDLPVSIAENGIKLYQIIRSKPKHSRKQEKHQTSEDLMHNLVDMGFALGFHDIDPDIDQEIAKPKNRFEEKVLAYIAD